MAKIKFVHTYDYIISLENLLEAWREFIRGKHLKKDVQIFESDLMDNIVSLHEDLSNYTYRHGSYEAFNISDPKPRNIHKATVRDRLVHHAIYRALYPFFDRTFISDSFSCRNKQGTHRALNRLRSFAFRVSHNHTRSCWILKCDIRKFFANIDHEVLKSILAEYISDKNILWLLDRVIDSFNSGQSGVGLPLGNLTSQLLVNIYMNKFDQFMKHKIKAKYYLRYADDFVILAESKKYLIGLIPVLVRFLSIELKLELHPQKVFIKTIASGVDFLGWTHFTDHRVLRVASRRRMFKKLWQNSSSKSVKSYLGLLKHGNTDKIKNKIYINFNERKIVFNNKASPFSRG